MLEDLVLIPVHTKPDDSVKELDELYDVFLEVKKKWKTDVSSEISHWQSLTPPLGLESALVTKNYIWAFDK